VAVDVEAVDVEATWHHFGATYLGTKLGAMDLASNSMPYVSALKL
jgi:hypothetical protein